MSSKSYDYQRIEEIERSVGLTKEQYEKKYLFHRLKERFLHSQDLSLETITPEGHENIYIPMDMQTPTQSDGLSYEDEQALRMHGAQICFQACNQLKLPLSTAITSLVIYHRFFAKNSFVDFDYREIVMASLYLAGKVEETVKNIWIISGVFTSVFPKQKQAPLDIIIKQEKLILRELGFELFRVSDHPHKFIESYYHFIKVDKQVAQKAWYYLNDSYMTDLCVHFPPQVIAAGALYLALRVCNHPMPTQPWWILLEATFTQIEQVAATIYNIYEFEKMDFRQARRILSKATNKIAYVIQHSEIYGVFEKIDKPIDFKKQQSIQQQQEQQNEKTDNKSPLKDKKSIKKQKSKSKEKKSKDKKNKSEKKKNKSQGKKEKKEKNNKKKKSRSRSNEKKSKKEKKKEKEREFREREKERERERELKDKEKELKEREIKEKDKKKTELEQDKLIESQENKPTDLKQDEGMIKSNMEIEIEKNSFDNNNQQQQLIQENKEYECYNTDRTNNGRQQQSIHDDQQLQTNVPVDKNQREQEQLKSKQFITQMRAMLNLQSKQDDKDIKMSNTNQQQKENQHSEQASESDSEGEELSKLKERILAKKRNEQ